jgi:hypothetical protein
MLFESSSGSYPRNIAKLVIIAAYSDSIFSNITSSVNCPARIRGILILDDSIIIKFDVD